MNTVDFNQLSDASLEDIALMEVDHLRDRELIADHVLSLLRSLDSGVPPFRVTHLEHMLQTASLAHAGYHSYHRLGRARNAREQYQGHAAFEATCRFCDEWDQKAFDPGAQAMSLDAFEPMLRRLFGKAPRL